MKRKPKYPSCKQLLLLLLPLLVSAAPVCGPTAGGGSKFQKVEYESLQGKAWNSRQVEIPDAGFIHYVDQNPGGKSTVLLVHGLALNLKSWRYQIDYLSGLGYRVVALDLPGFGKSNKRTKFGYGIAAYAAVLKAFIEKLKLKKPIYAGHSMGGHIGLELSIRYPGTIERLVLISPAGFEKFSAKEKKWFTDNFNETFLKANNNEIAIGISIRARNFANWRSDFEWLVKDRLLVAKSHDIGNYFNAIIHSVRGLTQTDFVRGNLKKVKLPVTVLYGDDDQLIPNHFFHPKLTTAGLMKEAAGKIPKASVKGFAGCGHTLQVDCWEKVNPALLKAVE